MHAPALGRRARRPSSTPASRPAKCDWPSTGSRRHDLRQPAREPPVVRFAPQRPIQPRRRHLERVLPLERRRQLVLDVEQRAQVLAHALAVVDRDRRPQPPACARRPRFAIEDDPQHPANRLAAELQVEESRARSSRRCARPRPASGPALSSGTGATSPRRRARQAPKTQKVGTGPLTKPFPLRPPRSIADGEGAVGTPQSCRTTLKRELLMVMGRSAEYSMKPSFLNLFRKKFTRERVVPTISARVIWEIVGTTRAGLFHSP